jgi:hypothetical protein
MKINHGTTNSFAIEVTREELMFINNALNEVCHGIHIEDPEFQTRLGGSRDELQSILDQINQAI